MSLTLKYCHVRFVEKNFFKGLVAVPDINNRQSQVLSRRSKSAFKITYSRLLSELGVEAFYRVLCAIVIGNQIIVRGNQPNQINAVLRLLEDLLPDACKQTLINQTNYQERWRCGLLGLSMDIPIPDCIDRSEILVLSIFESSDHEKISFEISTTAPDQRLTLAREYLEILSQNLPERLLWLAVQSKKEEWIQ